jgi:Protein tyrosine and serine/threonine kinase
MFCVDPEDHTNLSDVDGVALTAVVLLSVQGVWVPEGENVKIPVAIKALQEGTAPAQNKELLEEARVMASVVHPCCVRILAVCMTAQVSRR